MRQGTFLFSLIALLASLNLAIADQATAVASVSRGFVTGITITHPGSGYEVAPPVRITGGNGSGAVALAFVEAGAVVQIVVIAAGSNYTSAPLIEIDPPATMAIDLVARLTISGSLGSFHSVQWSDRLDSKAVWRHFTNITLRTAQIQVLDLVPSAQGHRYYRRVELVRSNTSFPGMSYIPPGTFVMGSPASEKERYDAEGQHVVTLTRGFWMGQREVTQGDYVSVIGFNPSYFKNGVAGIPPGTGHPVTNDVRHPVENVSWADATNYCAKLTQRERASGLIPAGYAYRLPTEAEWEFACRAGTTSAFSFGTAIRQGMANFETLDEYESAVGPQSNPNNVYLGRTVETGSFPANGFGLYDMHGNVTEWCLDWYGVYPTDPVTDPTGPASGELPILRGGGWNNPGWGCRSACRFFYSPGNRSGDVGFRVVLAPVR